MQLLFPVLFVFAVAAASVLGLLLVRLRVHHASLSKHNDVAGVMFSIVGTIYAVLLAFVVVVVWESNGTAGERTEQEAGILGDLVRDAILFPDPERTELLLEFYDYTKTVVGEEWPAMEKGGTSQHAWDVMNRIFLTFSKIKPDNPRDINIHAEMLRRLNELSDHRRLRLLAVDNKVPPMLWYLLVFGGVITIGFSYFLGVEKQRSHALMTASLAAMIALTLYLILALGRPFTGPMRVGPDAFQLVLERMEALRPSAPAR
jgi:hypothetical protein